MLVDALVVDASARVDARSRSDGGTAAERLLLDSLALIAPHRYEGCSGRREVAERASRGGMLRDEAPNTLVLASSPGAAGADRDADAERWLERVAAGRAKTVPR